MAVTGATLPGGAVGRGVLLLAGGRVVGVGDGLPVPPGVSRHDVAGAVVVPGVHDAHVHPVAAGLQAARCDLSASTERDEARALVRARVQQLTPGEWLLGGGLDPLLAQHGADVLAAAADRPTLLLDSDLHGGWANAAALRAAGFDPSTTDRRLTEATVEQVAAAAPLPGDAALSQALQFAQERLHSVGVVGWQDALVGPGLGLPDALPGYLRLVADGARTARITLALRWDPGRGGEQLGELRDRRVAAEAAGLRADRVKVFVDGVCEHGTAALLPAPDRPAAPEVLWPPGELAAVLTLLQGAGFRAHLHTVGDRAVRAALDAVAGAADRHGPGGGHQLAHLQVVHPDDVPRLAALGVVPVVQPLWACDTRQGRAQVEPVLGAAAYAAQYPFGDLVRAGAELAVGSDWPVSDPDPWRALEVGVTRTACLRSAPWLAAEDAGPPLDPAQALGPDVWLRALTAGSARACGTDDSGVLRPGAAADLAVLDRRPGASSPAGEDVVVLATLVAGRAVHDPRGIVSPA